MGEDAIFDVLYFSDLRDGESARREFQEAVHVDFPEAVLEDASDCVHLNRLSVQLCASKRSWYKWLAIHRFLGVSFLANMDCYEKEGREMLKEVVGELKSEPKANQSAPSGV